MSNPICCPDPMGDDLAPEAADHMAELLKALADPIRLRLVSIMANSPAGEVCACDLPAQLGRSQPTISHHLSALTRAGLIRREQRGRWAWFRLEESRLAELAAALTPPSVRA